MTDNETIAAQFAAEATHVAALRRTDAGFDELCRDFLLLYHELIRRSGRAAAAKDTRYVADLAESLADLRGEIETRLGRSHADRP